MTDLYFDDFHVGFTITSAGMTVTAAEILEFSRQYAPEAAHLDRHSPAAIEAGGLTAPLVQVLATGFRLFVETRALAAGGEAAAGADECRSVRPVLAGDTLHSVAEITGARLLQSRPGMGLIEMRLSVRNQRGEEVAFLRAKSFMRRAPHPAAVTNKGEPG